MIRIDNLKSSQLIDVPVPVAWGPGLDAVCKDRPELQPRMLIQWRQRAKVLHEPQEHKPLWSRPVDAEARLHTEAYAVSEQATRRI